MSVIKRDRPQRGLIRKGRFIPTCAEADSGRGFPKRFEVPARSYQLMSSLIGTLAVADPARYGLHKGGTAIYAFEPLLSVRFIATFRVVIALNFMIAVWADPAQPVRYAETGNTLLAAYLLWATINLWAAYRDWWIEFHLARPALLIDLAVGVGSIFFTEGAPQDFSTPLAAFLLFTLIESIFVGGWRLASTIGVLFTCGLVGVVGSLGLLGEAIDPVRIARRVGFFLVITALAVWFGGRRTTPFVPGFSIDSEPQGKLPIAEALGFACKSLMAGTGIVLWKTDEEAVTRLEFVGASSESARRVAHCSIDQLGSVAISPFLFKVGRDRALRLDESIRVVPDRVGNFADLELLPHGCDAVSIPIKTNGVRAVFILAGLRVANRDLLPLARAAAREIESGLGRHELSVMAFADRMGAIRQSVARDLHDSVSQSLAGASFRIEAARKSLEAGIDPAEELNAVHEALHAEQRHVRDIIERLRRGSEIRLRHDLVGDLSDLLDDLGEQWRLQLLFARPHETIEVGTSQLHEIRQIAREAVANAARHGGATQVQFSLSAEPRTLHLDIVDNGSRGSVGSTHPFQPRSIAERVAALGGTLDARRGPAGTRLYINVPRLSA